MTLFQLLLIVINASLVFGITLNMTNANLNRKERKN